MRILNRECKEKGIQILTHTPATKIIRGKGKELHRVSAKSQDTEYEISAKSVIITTGGYGNNKELLSKYCSYYNPEVAENQSAERECGGWN